MITNEMYDVHLQSIREIYVKLSLLQKFYIQEDSYIVKKFRKIGEIQGNVIDGSIDISSSSSIRRTCSLDIHITDSSFLISQDSKIWLDKGFKLEIGLLNLSTNKIVWFNKGIYMFNSPSIIYNFTQKNLHIEGLDLMCTIDGTLGGDLEITTKIPKEAGIVTSIKSTLTSLGKISKYDMYIENNNQLMPYDIEKDAGDSIYSILEELRDLYMDFEMFFDEEGRFIYQKIKNRYVLNLNPNFTNDIVVYNFIEENDLSSSYSVDYDFQNVKNKILIYGHTNDDTGNQITYSLENTDENSPFSINKLGVMPYIYSNDKIFNQEQADQRARYELWLHNNMNERVNIESVPIYFLDVNQMIEFNKPEIGLFGKFLIDSISIPLNYTGRMNISSYKVYAQ